MTEEKRPLGRPKNPEFSPPRPEVADEALKLRDPKYLKSFLNDGSRIMLVRLRTVMLEGSGKDFLDAAKLWERVILSKPTLSREPKGKGEGE